MNRIYAYVEGMSKETLKTLKIDTGAEVIATTKDQERHSPLRCPVCGNLSDFTMDLEFIAIGTVENGQFIMPDIRGELANLLDNIHYEHLWGAIGFLDYLSENEDKAINLPVEFNDQHPMSLNTAYCFMSEDFMDEFSERAFEVEMVECLNCREEAGVRDLRQGYDSKHSENCTGCFVCSNEFPSRDDVIRLCVLDLGRAMLETFPSKFDELKDNRALLTEELYNEMDEVEPKTGYGCIECGNKFLCANYGLSMREPEILEYAINEGLAMAQGGRGR